MCIWDLQCFETFRNCCLFCTFWHIRNFYCGDALHANYTKHSLNLHFQHCAHCVYDIYSICKVFEMAVCFARIGLFEIWTALILTMLAMVNVVQIIISDIAHSVSLRFTVFWNFSKLLFVLHILAYSKFLLRWGASCKLYQTKFKSSFPTLRTLCLWDLQYFQNFRNCCLFCTFCCFSKFELRWLW